LWYFVPMSAVHLAIFAAGCFAVVDSWMQPAIVRRRIGRLALFIGLLLVVGSLFNGLWSCLIYGRFYESTDYVFGFVPFWPFTEGWMEMRDARGELMGVSLRMQLIWLVFTTATWGVTVILYRFFHRRLSAGKSPERTECAGTPSASAIRGVILRWFGYPR
jgi:hypothetical protein